MHTETSILVSMSTQGKNIWISGASSGIGAALAIELASRGANLILSARRVDRLEEVRARCARPDDHISIPLDVTHPETHEAAFRKILERFGRLDMLVLNSGIGQRSAISETTNEIERRIMEVNYFGSTSLTRIVLPHFIEQNSGQFVVISSIMGKLSTPRRATYAASKHALHGYFEGLRAELHNTGISISMVCPGYVHTEISIHSLEGSGVPFGEMDDVHQNAMRVDLFARKAVRQIEKKKPICYIGGPERFAPYLERISPSFVRFALPRLVTRD